jgi:hypothetical protein
MRPCHPVTTETVEQWVFFPVDSQQGGRHTAPQSVQIDKQRNHPWNTIIKQGGFLTYHPSHTAFSYVNLFMLSSPPNANIFWTIL